MDITGSRNATLHLYKGTAQRLYCMLLTPKPSSHPLEMTDGWITSTRIASDHTSSQLHVNRAPEIFKDICKYDNYYNRLGRHLYKAQMQQSDQTVTAIGSDVCHLHCYSVIGSEVWHLIHGYCNRLGRLSHTRLLQSARTSADERLLQSARTSVSYTATANGSDVCLINGYCNRLRRLSVTRLPAIGSDVCPIHGYCNRLRRLSATTIWSYNCIYISPDIIQLRTTRLQYSAQTSANAAPAISVRGSDWLGMI